MKYALVMIAALALAGCVQEGDELTNTNNMIAVCIDGVSYWMLHPNTPSQVIAPRVGPETLTFVRCE
jgi:PBP1b-binding outer membrane lipoprotein LpoB